jgi:hypothetical protein
MCKETIISFISIILMKLRVLDLFIEADAVGTGKTVYI